MAWSSAAGLTALRHRSSAEMARCLMGLKRAYPATRLLTETPAGWLAYAPFQIFACKAAPGAYAPPCPSRIGRKATDSDSRRRRTSGLPAAVALFIAAVYADPPGLEIGERRGGLNGRRTALKPEIRKRRQA